MFRNIFQLTIAVGAVMLLIGCAAPAEPDDNGPSQATDVSPSESPTGQQISSSDLSSDNQRQPGTSSQEELAALVEGNSAFALDLYQHLKTDGGNLFYSPYSISLALAMTYGGARNQTDEQMAQALNFLLSQETLHPAFNTLDMTLLAYGGDNDSFELNVANAIWAQQGYQFLQSYLDLLAENYGAGLNTLDFTGDPDGSAETINDWVSEQTEERITDLVAPEMFALARLVLTNAIYFKGQWALPFEESATVDENFTLLDGSSVAVPMMSQTEGFRYTESDGYQAISMSYLGAPVSMIIVLPEEGRFEEVESLISAEFVDDLVADWGFQSVALSMPKFTYESEFSLTEILSAMGMPIAFSGEADFSGMTGSRELFISDVVHKAFVAVDEAGTEAAAATAVIMAESAAMIEDPVDMKIDRPFFYLIRDDDTGTILFAGRVLDPEE
jgi:serpin B